MKTYLLSVLVLILGAFTPFKLKSQDYTFKPVGNEVVFDGITDLTIKAGTGSEVKLYNKESAEMPSRAEGLRSVGASGAKDNTGIGLAVASKDGKSQVFQLMRNSGKFVAEVPANVTIHILHESNQKGDLYIDGFKGEITADLKYQDIRLNNVSGPLLINTIYGNIDASFTTISDKEMSLISIYGAVDLAIPSNAKLDLELSTSYGDIFTDLDIEFDKSEDGMRSLKSKELKGKLNSGGTQIRVKANYGNTYLRKK